MLTLANLKHMAPQRVCTVCVLFGIWRSMCSSLSYLVNTACLSIFICLERAHADSKPWLEGPRMIFEIENWINRESNPRKPVVNVPLWSRLKTVFPIIWKCICRQTRLKLASPSSVCVCFFFLFGRHFVGLEHLCLPRSSLIPCTLLFRLLKHRPHCCSHRGKASAELFCLYCKRQRERERAGKETRLRYWLFCLAATEPRWCGKKRKTSCVLFMTEWQTLPQGITGLADRLSQAVPQPASQPSRSFLLRSIRHCSRSRTNHAATINSPLLCFSWHLRNQSTNPTQKCFFKFWKKKKIKCNIYL